MIIVQAYLLPHGSTKHKESLGHVHIINDNTGTMTRRNYDVKLFSRGDKPRLVKEARVENWSANAKSAFKLVIEAMKALDKERKLKCLQSFTKAQLLKN